MTYPQDYLSPLAEAFEASRHPKNALQMKAYMKDKSEFYGIKSPDRKAIQREFWLEYGHPPAAKLAETVKTCWCHDQREWQLFAMDLLDKNKRSWPDDQLDLLEWLILNKSWWDTVDFIAATLVYKFYLLKPDHTISRMREWSQSENMWLNRSAIIFQLKCKKDTRTDLLEEFILPHLGSKEFFHQKAIGWALRQYGKFDPDWVIEFTERNTLKPLSKREALRIILA